MNTALDTIKQANQNVAALTDQAEDAKALQQQATDALTKLQEDAKTLTEQVAELTLIGEQTEAPETEEPTTEETQTEAPETEPETQAEQESGCKSVMLAGSMVLFLIGCAYVVSKKRD
jgi:hypothetical protein